MGRSQRLTLTEGSEERRDSTTGAYDPTVADYRDTSPYEWGGKETSTWPLNMQNRPVPLEEGEDASGTDAKEQHAIHCLQRTHHLPMAL